MEEEDVPATQLFRDSARSIVTRNDSPDIGFSASINPYRGCEHGCAYCYARPNHEYLGLSAGLDFETKLFVKEDAPALLEKELSSPRWSPETLVLSGVTDPYQPVERKLRVTRGCLEVLERFRNPVAMITKSELITRDLDLLASLAGLGAAAAYLSVTTLDPALSRLLEPRAALPERRLAALRALAAAGVPCGVMVAPVIPGLTDHEIPSILHAARAAGATRAGYVVLRLPHGVKELFEGWLRSRFPDRAEKVLARVRDLRGGALYDARFGVRQTGVGVWAEQIGQLFAASCRKEGFAAESAPLRTDAFRRPGGQLPLFS